MKVKKHFIPARYVILVICFLLFSPSLCVNAAEISTATYSSEENQYTDTQALLKKKLAILSTLYGATSTQYAVLKDGEIIFQGTSGNRDLELKLPATENTLYPIGSVSKVFTAAAVMKLVEAGRIDLDSPVINYLPEFTMSDERYTDITVRMLLNHSSGLMGSIYSNTMLLGSDNGYSHNIFLTKLSGQRLKADPGEFSVYCNDGFTLAEIMIEKITGMTFTKYLQTTILNPLNMTATFTPVSDLSSEELSKPYAQNYSKSMPADILAMIGAGGIYSTAADLCRFATVFTKDNSFFTADTKTAMECDEYKNGYWIDAQNNSLGYGLAWDCVNTYPFNLYDIKALCKGGDTLQSHAGMVVLPDQNMAAVVLTSGGSSSYNQIVANEILLSLLKETGTINEILPEVNYSEPEPAEIPASIKKNKGIYGTRLGFAKVSFEDNNLVLGVSKYSYCSDGYFIAPNKLSYLFFSKLKNGNTYLVEAQCIKAYGLGHTILVQPVAQKFKKNSISAELSTIWKNRSEKNYLMIDEPYNSQMYISGAASNIFKLSKSIKGYFGTNKIIDENTAVSILEIPCMAGRDTFDFSFSTDGDTEYMRAADITYISSDCIPNLSSKKSFNVTIDKTTGYAKWFKIGSKLKDRKISITLPKNSSFAVYTSEGACVNYSFISGDNTACLPENGYIVFSGDKGAKFKVIYMEE